MSDRYARYQNKVQSFMARTLSGASRHIVLVDVLEALANDREAFEEVTEIVHEVYRTLTQERPSWFGSIFGPATSRFDRVLFLATKSDSVPASQRGNLESLLKSMRLGACGKAAADAAAESVGHIAAIRTTVDVRCNINGHDVPAVKGLRAEDGRHVEVAALDLPDRVPESEYWANPERLWMPEFVPPKLEAGGRLGIPNVRLGEALDFVLGDLTS